MGRGHVGLAVFALLAAALAPPAFAQSELADVRPSTYHDVSPPLRDLPPGPRVYGVLEAEPVRRIPSSRNPTFGPDPLLRPTNIAPTALAPATLRNFDGIGQGFTGPAGTFTVNSAPADANAAVGPNHIVETVNTDFAVFNKAGTPTFGPVPINTLWSGFGGGCQTSNDGDPIVSYDRIADRWVISQFQVSSRPFQQCVAVSQTPDPTGAYNRYVFTYPDGFPDYPKMGVWPTISGGTGDADLYVRGGAKPTTTTFNCRPFLNGNSETCTFTNPAAGDWYVMIRGFATFSGVTLKGSFAP